ncbi:MAG: hypothetical protein ACLFQB_13890 [Chitinispirillaceae bacterium]
MEKNRTEKETENVSRYAHLTPAQKWAEAVKLRELAWKLKRAYIKQNHPDLSDEQVEERVRKIFLYAST